MKKDKVMRKAIALPPTTALRVIRAIMADSDLTPAQRVAAAAVVCQADGTTGLAWASYRQLRQDYALSADSIAKTLRRRQSQNDRPGANVAPGKAIDKYLIPVRRGPHGAICYRVNTKAVTTRFSALPGGALESELIMPSALTSGALAESQRPDQRSADENQRPDKRSADNRNNPPALRFSASSAPQSRAILTPYSKLTDSPPTPPRGFCARDKISLHELIEQIAEAYRQVVGRDLPASWRRKIRQEHRRGDKAALAEITAETLRAAERFRKERKLAVFGFGTVMAYLADRSRNDLTKHQVQTDRSRQAAEADSERQELSRQQAEAMEFFQSLPVDEQKRFIARVRDRPYAPTGRPDILLGMAANLAFEERESLAVTV